MRFSLYLPKKLYLDLENDRAGGNLEVGFQASRDLGPRASCGDALYREPTNKDQGFGSCPRSSVSVFCRAPTSPDLGKASIMSYDFGYCGLGWLRLRLRL